MTHSEQQIDEINNRKRTAMQEVNDMFETLNWQDFLAYMINALPMLLDKEKEQITNAYQKADFAYLEDSIADAENYYNQTYKS
jgi:hypothetical protein